MVSRSCYDLPDVQCPHSSWRPELHTEILGVMSLTQWCARASLCHLGRVDCIFSQLSIQLQHTKTSHGGSHYTTEISKHHQWGRTFPSGRPCGYTFTSTSLALWWVNTGILHATLHGDSLGIIPNQYSVVYQPRNLQHSSAEYIVWPNVTQPVSGRVGILMLGVFCLPHSSSSAPPATSGERRFCRQPAWLYRLTSYMTIGKLPAFSIPNFPHLLKRSKNNVYFIMIPWRLKEVMNPRN